MAPAAHDSDSNDSNAEASPRLKSHGGSPEQDGQSDQDGPEDSGEEREGEGEVYEIEAILDAKRGATGSVRFLGHPLRINRVLFLFQDKNRLPSQVERLYRRRE